jgi:hypothetical protein
MTAGLTRCYFNDSPGGDDDGTEANGSGGSREPSLGRV